ncbi:response regulator [Xanthomonas arboricola]|uniref:response regulator n=1 Tax=Xanthomonas arboricola TaxID=56448 RepID=UPI000F8D48E2|nr:response regulator [Xanthomonas arboricola]
MSVDLDTSEKIASLVAALIAIVSFLSWRSKGRDRTPTEDQSNNLSQSNNQSVVVNLPHKDQSKEDAEALPSEANLKSSRRILFVDDDRAFKMVAILKKMGWINTKLVTDVVSLDSPPLLEADVVFVDIQGVGRSMQYTDEGLGLTLAIKRRYPLKKVVIYSSQTQGPQFHEAHRVADYALSKTAEPIQFEEVILQVLRR